jgi:hypothetical protein
MISAGTFFCKMPFAWVFKNLRFFLSKRCFSFLKGFKILFLKTCVFRMPAPDVAEHRGEEKPLLAGRIPHKKIVSKSSDLGTIFLRCFVMQ